MLEHLAEHGCSDQLGKAWCRHLEAQVLSVVSLNSGVPKLHTALAQKKQLPKEKQANKDAQRHA